ncbi:MAG: dephospho-CoA kinase [Myxococcales bacterium]|nr:dephospho-CoA kinase [Myxococcales bacterium]
MKRVGLTGGIATGKSTVAAMFVELGACLVDADRAAREVVRPHMPAWKDIVDAFGPGVLRPDETLDRPKLGAIVFADGDARARLEAITHPRIYEWMAARDAECAASGAAVCLVDVPLLFEKGLQGLYDRVVLVQVPRPVQLARLIARDGIAPADAEARLAAQMPIEDKIALADHVIDNGGDLAATRRRVDEVWRALTASDAPDGR